MNAHFITNEDVVELFASAQVFSSGRPVRREVLLPSYEAPPLPPLPPRFVYVVPAAPEVVIDTCPRCGGVLERRPGVRNAIHLGKAGACR